MLVEGKFTQVEIGLQVGANAVIILTCGEVFLGGLRVTLPGGAFMRSKSSGSQSAVSHLKLRKKSIT
jgi:hypothetical protein